MTSLKRPQKNRFGVGARVLVGMSRQVGIVLHVDDEPSILGEYVHRVRTKNGELEAVGCELELVPAPQTNMESAVPSEEQNDRTYARLAIEEVWNSAPEDDWTRKESDMASWLLPQVRAFLLEEFRSLDAALDEHKAKGTKPGDPVYEHIFKQLADDVAQKGVGVDRIDVAAYAVGQISTYNRLRSLMPKQLSPDEQEAITHLQNQIEALAQIRGKAEQGNASSPQFIQWKSHTSDLMTHYVSAKSEHLRKFRSLSFQSNILLLDYPSGRHSGPRRDDIEKFNSDSDVAVACLEGAIQHIKVFGLKQDEPAAPAKPARGRGAAQSGITQHIHGNVNQAIATGRATQNVGQIGPSGNSLDEIVKLLQQSYELTRRQMEDAIGAANQLDAETKKPEGGRNWKSIAEWGNTLLGIAGKATDLTERLAPHLPWITALVEQATHHG